MGEVCPKHRREGLSQGLSTVQDGPVGGEGAWGGATALKRSS
jgi:hypothetical protein